MKLTKNRLIKPIIVILACMLSVTAAAQNPSNCPNSNFNLGDFTGWVGFYGDFWNPDEHMGFASTRHTIIYTSEGYDHNTCFELDPVPPGENYSLRLGNDKVNAEAEQIRYSIDVTEETSLFIYKYAVVLEDPDHIPEEQPNFTIEVADVGGNLIDTACGYYYVYAHQGMPTWHSCGSVIWKDWTTVGIDLTPYIGQTVSIKFTTRDCAQTGHFGYAYLSAYCSRLQIEFGFCPDDTVATVTAPPGFSYLWANGATTQSITVQNPEYGRIDTCELTSANGCKVTITGSFLPTIVNADFGYEMQCAGTAVPFSDSSTTNQNHITHWTWDFGDGSPAISNVQNPQHVYDSAGTYETTLIAASTEGCPDTITKLVEVVEIPVADFSTYVKCSEKPAADTIYFDGQVELIVPPGYDSYSWNTGDSSYSILVTEEGWYTVVIANAGICIVTDSVLMLDCYVPLIMPNAFTPDNDGLNDRFRPVTQPEKVSAFHMTIFDRWGNHLYETRDIYEGWNGRIDGKQAPPGVYVYTLTYENPSGQRRNLSGTVILVQ